MGVLAPQPHAQDGARGPCGASEWEPPVRGSEGGSSLCARPGAAALLPTGLAAGVDGLLAAEGLHRPRLLTDVFHTQSLETYKDVTNNLEKNNFT